VDLQWIWANYMAKERRSLLKAGLDTSSRNGTFSWKHGLLQVRQAPLSAQRPRASAKRPAISGDRPAVCQNAVQRLPKAGPELLLGMASPGPRRWSSITRALTQ